MEAERQAWLEENEKRKQQEYLDNVGKMDAQYDALPQYFKDRIDRFRANNDRFRIDYEGYELFCCEQAVIIANALKSSEAVKEFNDLKWEEQFKAVPEISHDHSGNTFGCSVQLAYWYLKEPEVVAKLHGALSPLVGSKEYGDVKKD